MPTKLSEQLADLSVRAKKAEDSVTAAQVEARDKLETRKQQARATATTAMEKINKEIKSVDDTVSGKWNAARAKINADLNTLKTEVTQVKHDRDVKRAERQADELEWEARFAIDYAVASIEQAALASLAAIQGRMDANQITQT
jgi:hypothetical protein